MRNNNVIEAHDIQKKLIKDYWIKKISSIDNFFIHQDGESSPNRFNVLDFDVDQAIISRIKIIAKGNQINEYIILLSFFNILLYKYYGHPDIIVSSPGLKDGPDIDNDDDGDILLFYKSNLEEYQSIKTIFKDIRGEFHESIDYIGYNFKELQSILGKKGIRDNLFCRFGFYDNRVNRVSLEFEHISLQLRIEASADGKLQMQIKYDKSVFSEDFILRFISHYRNILQYIYESLDTTVGEVEILSSSEKQELLVDFNDTAKEYPENKTIPELFEDQVLGTPDNIAVIAPSITADIQLSYRELNERSERLASWLGEKGVEPDTIVGIMIERSIEMIIGILGILKAGGSYLPIDQKYPQERIDYMLNDSGAKIIVGTGSTELNSQLYVINCELLMSVPGAPFHHSSCIIHHSSHIAYVIYTSGSTGRPKGVMIEHRSVINRLKWMQDIYSIGPGDAILQKTPITFDVSVWELFWWSFWGADLCLLGPGDEKSPQEIVKAVERYRITTMHFVPSMLNAFLEYLETAGGAVSRLKSLKQVFSSGEALEVEQVKKFYRLFNTGESPKLINLYGPTEATVDVSHFDCSGKKAKEKIPIGKPIYNIRLYILDKKMRLQPIGIAGELCISGIGLARGYLNRPQLTVEKFIDSHHASFIIHHTKLYRTGDLARWLPYGNIQYIGRMDFQVKIRGHRIECGEIESKLKNLEAVKEAVVIVRDDEQGNKYLAAYFTAEKEVTSWECYAYLETILPDFMIPAFFIQLKQFPLTTTGKVDRKPLPEPSADNLSKTQYEAPGNEIEKELAVIWQEVLNVDKIGINDNFFQLGGNSLLGIRVVNKVQEWLGEIIHVTALFNAPTIKELAVQLEPYRLDTTSKVNKTKVAEFMKIVKPLPPLKIFGPKNPPAAFILSPPRCGTTLLRVILTGHPELFSPPELELLSFNTLMERKQELTGKFGYFAEGTIRAIMEIKGCRADEAQTMMKEFERQGLTVREFYRTMQQWLGNRLLIDKTPWYALNLDVLKQSEDYFEEPRYIHLLRNPYAAIHSFENARLDQIFRYEHNFSCRELAELVWYTCNQNILEFFKLIPPERKHTVKFEELVRNPKPVVRDICNFFAIDYREEMIKVYQDTGKKMLNGILPESKMLGDINFLTHTAIDPNVNDKWQEKYKIDFLGDITVQFAQSLGYLEDRIDAHSFEIEPAPQLDYYSLSPAQIRLWILDQFQENNTTYNIPLAFQVEGYLNRKVLEKAIETIIRRHESLRTTFTIIEGVPSQKIHDFESTGFKLQHIDLKDRNDREDEAHQLVRNELKMPFDLQQGPLLKVILIYLEEKKVVLFFSLHHIICDGWSMRLLFNEVMCLYEAYIEHKINPLPQMRFQYKDYSHWINSEKGRKIMNRAANFWLQEFSGEIPVLTLPTDSPRPAAQSFEGNRFGFHIGRKESDALKQMEFEEGATSFMVILSIFNILLSKLSGQEDIIVGIDIEGRRHADTRDIIGMFVNTLALRNFPDTGKTFKEFLGQVKERTLKAFDNQDYQFEELVEKVSTARDTSRNPIFDVMFSFMDLKSIKKHTARIESRNYSQLKLEPYSFEGITSKFDLTLNTRETAEDFRFSFQYCTQLFRKETIQRFAGYFKQIVLSVIENRNRMISQIHIISLEEKNQILFEFNNTLAPLVRDKNYSQLFEEQVSKNPDKIAATYDDCQITYYELNEEANRIAAILSGQGIIANRLVPLVLKRSVAMLAGIIGIFKAGGTYVPIEVDYPPARIEYILEDSEAQIVITENDYLEMIEEIQGSSSSSKLKETGLFCLNQWRRVNSILDGESLKNTVKPCGPDDLAYIIYTSGTTGKPKGVVIHQLGMINHLHAKISDLGIGIDDIIAQTASACFDISVWQFLAGLLRGGMTCIIDKKIVLEGGKFLHILRQKQVTILETVPYLMKVLLEVAANEINKGLDRLRWMIPTGESLAVSLAREWFRHYPGTKLVNAYGPTEASDDVTHYKLNEKPSETQTSIPIGKPLQNLHIYILDKNLSLCPVGVRGELCVSGIGVGKGYWKNQEKTGKAFIPNPYFEEIGDTDYARIYKTGDTGYFRPDGNIEFIGRIDHQVKIRGFRVELGEIENQLLKISGVKEAVVLAREEDGGDKYIFAYFVSDIEYEISELRESLAKELPDYMMPSYFVRLDKIPLTHNGKIDRKSLPSPEIIPEEDYIPPRNKLEQQLVRIWAETLGLEELRIGIDSNFFQVGGHSLKATVLISRIHKELNAKVPLAEIFKTPTIRGLARYLSRTIEDKFISLEAVENREYYPLSSAQMRLYLIQQMDLKSTAYNMPEIYISEERLDKEKLKKTFMKLIERHESLRTSFELVSGQPVQHVHDHVEFEIEYYGISKVEVTNEAAESEKTIKEFIRPFDLSMAPLIRIGLFKAKENKHILMIDMHHIISDGVSHGILAKDFIVLYGGAEQPALRLHYKDFIYWQNNFIDSGEMKKQEQYWLKEFEGDIPGLNLPMDYNRPEEQSFEGDSIQFEISSNETNVLKDWSRNENASLFMVLLAIYNVLLSKLSAQEDIIVGVGTAGRRHADLEKIIGLFVNTLAMRNYPVKEITFKEFLREVRDRTLQAFENQDYLFENLVEKVIKKRDLNRNPLFDTVFMVQNPGDEAVDISIIEKFTLTLKPYRQESIISKFDMFWGCTEVDEGLRFSVIYRTKLFEKQTIEIFIGCFQEIVKTILENDEILLKEINISQDLQTANTVVPGYDFAF